MTQTPASFLSTLSDELAAAKAERNTFKAKSLARGRLLERFRCHVQEIVDHADDEGDRVYFGSSNHFEHLKEMSQEMDMWKWDAVIREHSEVDPYAEMRRLRGEINRLREALTPFAEVGEYILAEAPPTATMWHAFVDSEGDAAQISLEYLRRAITLVKGETP